jgi:hypothetical protein
VNKIIASIALAIATLLCVFSVSNSALATTPSDAIPCEAGRYSSTGYASVTESVSCELTPPGTYQDASSATAPISCPAGTFQPNSGSMSCVQSMPGTYAPSNSAAALPCAEGSYSAAGQGSCSVASPGYYALGDKSMQVMCPAGTYQALSGQITCLMAAAGSYVADMGSSDATPCAVGTFQPNTNSVTCVPAGLGTYVDATGATQATNCPIHVTTASTGATSAADCNISTVVTIFTSPTPSESPTAAPIASPTPSATATPVAIAKRVQDSTSLKIPKKLKAGGKFTFSKSLSMSPVSKASVSGPCKISSGRNTFTVAATGKAGTCNLTVSNGGNATYLALKAKFAVKVVR